MNREIKFRAWDKRRKKIVFDFLVGSKGNIEHIKGYTDDDGLITEEVNDDWIATDKGNKNVWDVMQYTGLKDKNGVEIYEGDIIAYRITTSPYGYEEHEDFKGIVKFESGAFYAGFEIDHGNQWNYGGGNALLSCVISDFKPEDYSCEVIGNIYENPKLLED